MPYPVRFPLLPRSGLARPGSATCLLLVFTMALLAGCASPTPSNSANDSPPPQSETLLQQKLLRAINLERQLDQLAEEAPEDSPEVRRRFQEVVRIYEDILSGFTDPLDPELLDTRLLYGKLLLRYGDHSNAKMQLLAAARIDPDLAVIHHQLGTLFAETNDPTRALAYTLNAIRLEPDTATYHFALGQLLAAFRKTYLNEDIFSREELDRDLLKAFRTAASLEPESLPFQLRYGEAFYDVRNPDWEEALQHWISVARRNDLSSLQRESVRLHRAHCLIRLNRRDLARQLLQPVTHSALQPTRDSLLQLLNQPGKRGDR